MKRARVFSDGPQLKFNAQFLLRLLLLIPSAFKRINCDILYNSSKEIIFPFSLFSKKKMNGMKKNEKLYVVCVRAAIWCESMQLFHVKYICKNWINNLLLLLQSLVICVCRFFIQFYFYFTYIAFYCFFFFKFHMNNDFVCFGISSLKEKGIIILKKDYTNVDFEEFSCVWTVCELSQICYLIPAAFFRYVLIWHSNKWSSIKITYLCLLLFLCEEKMKCGNKRIYNLCLNIMTCVYK